MPTQAIISIDSIEISNHMRSHDLGALGKPTEAIGGREWVGGSLRCLLHYIM